MSNEFKGASISSSNFFHSSDSKDIILPNHEIFGSVRTAVDIGGSLAKIVYYTKTKTTSGGRLNFIKFETEKIGECINFLKQTMGSSIVKTSIMATGGGAHKYEQLLEKELGVKLVKMDEMECLIRGLNFLLMNIPCEAFSYNFKESSDLVKYEEVVFDAPRLFPYLLVNIGSGVSILKVTGENCFERVSGTSLGGGTLWGLLSLLTDAKDFDEMLELSKHGDNKNVDMLVGDIYGMGLGGNYDKIGLKSSIIASSFGKVFKKDQGERKSGFFKQEDIAASLLYMVSNNIGQISYLNAQKHGIQRIYFGGCFIRGHPRTMETLSYAIDFWSKGLMKAYFLRHEGYLGALGAFLGENDDVTLTLRDGSFFENFTFSQFISPTAISGFGPLDKIQQNVGIFPLLSNPEEYLPDTFNVDTIEKANYWINLMEKNLGLWVQLALNTSPNHETEAFSFSKMYRGHLQRLREDPFVYGTMSVRSLFGLRELCLRECGFQDIFTFIKDRENLQALEKLPERLKDIDSLSEEKKLEYLVKGVLAGNMFDWGSSCLTSSLAEGSLNFDTAYRDVGRGGKYDQYADFEASIKEKIPEKIIIFVDNSGADIVLGILPFARYFLERGSFVVLAANTYPSVNDVTVNELKSVLSSVKDATIRLSISEGKLLVFESGSSSPFLDLRKVDQRLCDFASLESCDLVIIEGMGRAIHTNLFANFKCNALKIATIKNEAVANALESKLYDAVCLFSCPGS